MGHVRGARRRRRGCLIATAEAWLRGQGMVRALGPVSLSIWDEPGLEIEGFDQPPTVMMGHHRPEYAGWIESAGYAKAKDLLTYEVNIADWWNDAIARLIAMGEKNPRIRIREVDKSRFAEEAEIILTILNDAWSDNWGYIPLTESEIAYAGKKLKPIIFNELVRVAEYDGEPVAFMLTIPTSTSSPAILMANSFRWLGEIAVALAQAANAPGTRAADACASNSTDAPRQPARLHADRVHPPRGGRKLGLRSGVRLVLEDIGDAVDRAASRREDQHRYRIYEKALS